MKKLFKAFLALAMACTLVTNATTTKAEEPSILDLTVSVDENVLGTVEVDDSYNMTANLIKGGTYDLSVLTVNAKTSGLEEFGIPSTEKTRDFATGINGIEIGLDQYLNAVTSFSTSTLVGNVDGVEFEYTLANTTGDNTDSYVISGTAVSGVEEAITELYSHVTVVNDGSENGYVIPEGTEYSGTEDTFVVEIPARAELAFQGYKLVLNENTTITLTGEGIGSIILEQIEDIDFATMTREELMQVAVLLLNPVAEAINNNTVTLDVQFDSPFADVSKDNENLWYYEPIIRINALGLMTGKSAGNFAKNDDLSRAATATVLYRMSKDTVSGDAISSDEIFPDVADTWYTDAITWAYETGVVTGHDNGTFKPDAGVTRQQLAVMLQRYAEKILGLDVTVDAVDFSEFSDGTAVAPWADEAMQWAIDNGIIKGNDDATLRPGNTATRAQCAVMIMRFYDAFVK